MNLSRTGNEQYGNRNQSAEIQAIINLYAQAYVDSGLTAEEVLEEILCDSIGKMNAFATESTRSLAGEVGVFLRNVRKNVRRQEGGQKKNATGDGGVNKGLQRSGYFDDAEIQAIQSIGRKSINYFSASDIQKTEKFAKRYWEEMGEKSPFFRAWFGDWREKDTTLITVATAPGSTRGLHRNQDTGWDINISGKVFNESRAHNSLANREARAYLPYLDSIVENAVLLDSFGATPKSTNTLLMHSLYAVADIGKGPEVIKLYVEEINNPNSKSTSKRAYNLQNIEKAFAASVRVQGMTPSPITNTANAIRTVSDLFTAVKRMDANFIPKPSSKVVNDDGTPKVVYHGTNYLFWEFDLTKSGSNYGEVSEGLFFFTNKKNAYPDSAADYAREAVKRKGGDERIVEAYLKIEKPLRLDSKGYLTPVEYFDNNADVIYDKYFDGDYDGIIIENSDKSLDDSTIYLVDNPTQIKSATDNIGTFDGSNPDIRYSWEMDPVAALEEQVKLLRQQKEYWKSQTKRTDGKKADSKAVRKLGREILFQYGSSTKLDAFLSDLQWLADEWHNYSQNSTMNGMQDRAEEIARTILEGSGVDVNGDMAETRKELKAFLKGRPINVTEGINQTAYFEQK